MILDIELENSNGLDLLAKIKNIKTSPIVMIFSNISSISYKEKVLKGKADYFFDKTDDFEELVITIENLIKNDRGGR